STSASSPRTWTMRVRSRASYLCAGGTSMSPNPAEPTLPDLVRRWALDHVVDRKVVLDDARLSGHDSTILDWWLRGAKIVEARPIDIGADRWRVVLEIPEGKVAWSYLGRI